MRASTIIIVLASIGFIVMGLLMLKSKKIRSLLDNSNLYLDSEKFTKVNGRFNIIIGIIGIILGGLDYIFVQQSKYIVLLFIAVISLLSFIQSRKAKEYRVF